MNAKHGLEDKTVAQITEVLSRFPEVEKALLFGSRAKGTHTRGSDIDLALVGENVAWQTIGQINNALDDLPIPYRFSLIAFTKRTDSEVAAHIHRVGIPFFEREMALANRPSERKRSCLYAIRHLLPFTFEDADGTVRNTFTYDPATQGHA